MGNKLEIKQTYIVPARLEDALQHLESFIHVPAAAGSLEERLEKSVGFDTSSIRVLKVNTRKFVALMQVMGKTAAGVYELFPDPQGTRIVVTTETNSHVASLFARALLKLPAFKREGQRWAKEFAAYIAAQKKAEGPALGA